METSRDLEFAFIRQFAVGGLQLGLDLNPNDRRERIRVAIFKAHLEKELFDGGPYTYADVYKMCYGMSLEQRLKPREPKTETPPPPPVEEDEDEDDEEEDDEEEDPDGDAARLFK